MMLDMGHGWRDSRGRARRLVWMSDPGWLIWDDGTLDVRIIRRGVHDELSLRAVLLEWPDHVDDPRGPDWVESRMYSWPHPRPSQMCVICQGEGFVAGHEGVAVRCGCGDPL